MKRQELQQQLKQLRKEGYVKEGFTLVASTADLAEEYHEAKNRKRSHESQLLEQAYECEQAFYTRQAAQQELEQHVEKQAEQTANVPLAIIPSADCWDGVEMPSEPGFPLTCDILDGWVGRTCDVANDAADWYDYDPIEVEQEGDVEALIEIGFPLTCDVLGSWYGVYCNTDPDASYNYDRSNVAVNRVIKSLLPEPKSQGFHLLRKLRQLV